jgi:hypothetical protein
VSGHLTLLAKNAEKLSKRLIVIVRPMSRKQAVELCFNKIIRDDKWLQHCHRSHAFKVKRVRDAINPANKMTFAECLANIFVWAREHFT